MFDRGDHDLTARVQYDFSLNEFDGNTFGRRHSVTTSFLSDRWDVADLIYWTIDYSDFSDNGIDRDVIA
jgi:hypothetical protein